MSLPSDKNKNFKTGDLVYIYDNDASNPPWVHGMIMGKNPESYLMWDILVYETVVTLSQNFIFKNTPHITGYPIDKIHSK